MTPWLGTKSSNDPVVRGMTRGLKKKTWRKRFCLQSTHLFWYTLSMPDGTGIPIVFWASETGDEPVRDWLKGLDKEDRRQIGEDIKTVQFGWPVGMPVCRPMGKGLFEVRSRISDGRIARVLFCFHEGRIVLLHGFIKKTQKTPNPDLALALKRQKQME